VAEVCQKAGVPLVVHFHGFDAYEQETLAKYGPAYLRMFASAATLIAVSHEMEKQLVALGAPQEKIVYNPCGVDLTHFSGGNPALSPPVFVAIGRFVEKKAPHLTLRAFEKVLKEVPSARLIMIGDGPLWEECRRLAQTSGMAEAVEFRGVRPHKEVAAAMRAARALVQHSVRARSGDSEGTPVAVLEAGATGLPVVATRHGGIGDVVLDGQTGFLVKERDWEGMAQRMIQVAQDPELAGRLGRQARERVAAEYDMEKSLGRLGEIIRQAIARKQHQTKRE
jgi:glycosyltransferase involved in cell wall biosynthesis